MRVVTNGTFKYANVNSQNTLKILSARFQPFILEDLHEMIQTLINGYRGSGN